MNEAFELVQDYLPELEFFVKEGRLPRKDDKYAWTALSTLFHNYRRREVVRLAKQRSRKFKQFVHFDTKWAQRKRLLKDDDCKIFARAVGKALLDKVKEEAEEEEEGEEEEEKHDDGLHHH